MSETARQQYFAAEVLTATPQKRHLMLIEAAIRLAERTLEHWRRNEQSPAVDCIVRCQRIMVELVKGLRPEQNPDLVGPVAGVYLFVYRSLVLGQAQRNPERVKDALRVLEVERGTWQEVCRQLGERTAHPESSAAAESSLVLEA